jgi:hypothetical protein
LEEWTKQHPKITHRNNKEEETVSLKEFQKVVAEVEYLKAEMADLKLKHQQDLQQLREEMMTMIVTSLKK